MRFVSRILSQFNRRPATGGAPAAGGRRGTAATGGLGGALRRFLR